MKAVLTALTAPLTSHADVVMSAQSVVSAPPPIGTFTFDRTIDQSGLTINYVSGVTDFATYVAALPQHIRNNSPANYAASFANTPVDIDYDLGASVSVNELAFWNYPFSNSAGVTGLEIYTSAVSDFSSSLLAGTFAPVDDGNMTSNTVQVFDLTDSTAQYVRLHVTSTQTFGSVGFSEVAFRSS